MRSSASEAMVSQVNSPEIEAFTKYATSPDCKCEVCKQAHQQQVYVTFCPHCGYTPLKYGVKTGKVDGRFLVVELCERLTNAGWTSDKKPIRRNNGLIMDMRPPVDMTNLRGVVFAAAENEAYALFSDAEGWMSAMTLIDVDPSIMDGEFLKRAQETTVKQFHDVPDGVLAVYTRILA